MARQPRLGMQPWSLSAAVIGFVMLAIYLTLVRSQGDGWSAAFPWSLLMATAAVGALAGAVVADRRWARALVIGATVLFAVIGVASILTIGIGFLMAAAAAGIAATRLSP